MAQMKHGLTVLAFLSMMSAAPALARASHSDDAGVTSGSAVTRAAADPGTSTPAAPDASADKATDDAAPGSSDDRYRLREMGTGSRSDTGGDAMRPAETPPARPVVAASIAPDSSQVRQGAPDPAVHKALP